jgi:hypothetical protein
MPTTRASIPAKEDNAFYVLMKRKFLLEGISVIAANPTATGFLSKITINCPEDPYGSAPRAFFDIGCLLINHPIYKTLKNGDDWYFHFECGEIDREGFCFIQKVSATEMKLDFYTNSISELNAEIEAEENEDPCDIQHPTSPQAGCPMELVE